MEVSYRIIAEINIYHDFFTNGNCPHIQLIPTEETQWVFNRLQLIFRQTANNCWVLLSSNETDCSSPWEENIELRQKITNPSFWYYTSFKEERSCNLQIDNIRFTISETTIMNGLRGEPVKKMISFSSPATFWKYIFIPNVENGRIKKLHFIDQSSHQLKFKQENVTTIGERTAFVFISTKPVQLKENYEYRFELFEERQHGEKLLRKDIAFPEIGAYDPETRMDKLKTLSQYIYY